MSKFLFALLLCIGLSACSITRLPEDMGYGVLNNDDLDTVRDGLPTYLLLIDGALITYPESKSLLLTASSLNSAYSGVFVQDEARKLKMTIKAFDMAKRAACIHKKTLCDVQAMSHDEFVEVVSKLKKSKDVPVMYTLASAWTSHIQLTADDYNSIAALGRVQYLMERVVEIEPEYEYGMPLVYLGALNSLLPPALGGKPDIAKDYFERAIAVSEEKPHCQGHVR